MCVINVTYCIQSMLCFIYLQAFEALVKEMGAAAEKNPQNDTLKSHNYKLHESVDGDRPRMKCLQCF